MPKNILVIDDEPQIRSLLSEMLKKAGYSVILAADGKEGISLYKENSIDLVITDIIMPDKEGLEIIRELKRNYPDIKVIAMSGGGAGKPEDYLSMAEKFGAKRILRKPFTMQDVMGAVSELI